MKALSLTQPWATLVAIGKKKIETRSWYTGYRGPLAIHAAKGLDAVGGMTGLQHMVAVEPFFSACEVTPFRPHFPLGCVVATCVLVACVKIHAGDVWYPVCRVPDGKRWILTGQERDFGDYTPGRFAWLLGDIKPLPEPIPARGSLGLWEWSSDEALH